MRQKHTQQQKIVNKLIHFLMAVVQPRMAGMKRRYGVPGIHLAIEDNEEPNGKMPKMESSSGPVIQDVTNSDPLATLLEGVGVPNVELPTSPRVEVPHKSEGKYRLVDPQSVSPSMSQVNNQSALSLSQSSPKRPGLNREISKEDFDLDINNMQAELDNLKDILSGQITLDTSLVSSLFSPEDTLPNLGNLGNLSNLPANISLSADGLLNDDNELNGDQNMISYNPSLFELTEEEDDGQGFLNSLNTPSSSAHLESCLNTPQPSSLDLNTPQISEDTTNPLASLEKLDALLNLLEKENIAKK
ncbi:heat shock factor protein 1 isoform X2 [Eurytemora carolleeae]|uniref:heat shock factor protein 1 isoform X2 n=1 Tax=Eurytemora carolleeae TaxID=1294199 RepID=UPI000C781A55|nr:heat shock factor protein 1 isoform X2 [Eurytemora carolleeae]XP_023327840.1 heat shock factor protein 1 isoform X2 [Eurytemora carolleeae]|eukprot:XP_023327839.1 heat shock factor protein 1-like isoform X2 [Eurytemora affinis]